MWISRNRALERGRVLRSTNTKWIKNQQEIFFFFKASFQQRIDYEWKTCDTLRGSFRAEAWCVWTCTKTHSSLHTHTLTHAHRQSNVLTPFLFYLFFFICLVCVVFIYRNKGWPEHACLTYVRVGVYIREKVLFFFFCSPIVCCFWCGHMVVDWNVKSWEMSLIEWLCECWCV